MTIKIKTATEIAKMRVAGKLAAEVLEMIEPFVQPGVTTEELNDICHDYIVNKQKAIPAPLNYAVKGHSQPYPKSICTSVNEVVCHGIPRASEKLKNGSIINIDVTVIKDGYHGDTSKMYFVGKPANRNEDRLAQRLMRVTQECLYLGIAQAKPGNTLNDIGKAIEKHAHENKFSVVQEYCGHGIGNEFHEEPQVMHFDTYENDIAIKPGMIFTIEPMINAGGRKIKSVTEKINGKDYDWKIVTADGQLSAQWEHTILITESGNEILTKREEERSLT
jgi:methionyl aminopeptidase